MHEYKLCGAFNRWYNKEDTLNACAVEAELISPIIEHFKPSNTLCLGNVPWKNLPVNTLRTSTPECYSQNVDTLIDYRKMPFQDECFDLVICPHWHEAVSHTTCLLSEIARVLMPEGLAVMYSINAHGMPVLFQSLLNSDIRSWQRRVYSPAQLTHEAELWQLEQAYHLYGGRQSSHSNHQIQVQHQSRLFGTLHQVVLKKAVLATTMLGVDLSQWALNMST